MKGNPKFGLNYSSGELQMEFTNFQLCRVWYGGFLSLENCYLEIVPAICYNAMLQSQATKITMDKGSFLSQELKV